MTPTIGQDRQQPLDISSYICDGHCWTHKTTCREVSRAMFLPTSPGSSKENTSPLFAFTLAVDRGCLTNGIYAALETISLSSEGHCTPTIAGHPPLSSRFPLPKPNLVIPNRRLLLLLRHSKQFQTTQTRPFLNVHGQRKLLWTVARGPALSNKGTPE